MSEYNSFSHLRRLKRQQGVGIDNSGSSSAYILESRIKRRVESAYREDDFFSTRFQEKLGKLNLPKLSVLKRIEKMEDWQLRAVKQVMDEQGVFDAIVAVYSIKKTDRRLYLPKEAEDADEPELDEMEAD